MQRTIRSSKPAKILPLHGCSRVRNTAQPSIVERLAHGYFNRHPDRGLLIVVLLFGLAGAIAPAADLLIGGGQ